LFKRNKQPYHEILFHIEDFFIVKFAWGEARKGIG
jgi:hypothetical protein